ncbi:MAG: BatD family protein [Endomicrobiaceae bacterium]|nr:BatD family protein [Endomicrobiaceae bacterium]
MLKKSIFLLFILLIPFLLFANEIFNISLDKREIFEGENIKLSVELSESIKDSDIFQLPKIEDFLVLSKRNYRKNGQYTYEYIITPKTSGFFTIPSVTVYDADQKEVVSSPIEVHVLKTQKVQANYTMSDENTFVKAYVDTEVAYVNQQVYYTLEFATRYDLHSNPSYILPMFKDFWKNKSNVKSGYELIGGENYFTFKVTTQLYPMRDGNIIIDSSLVEVKYLNNKNKYTFKTNPIKIKVFSLPQKNIPENFTGAVGKYYITSSINKINVKVNEPVNLTIHIKGNGNINSITEPVFELSSDIKKYATFVNIDTDEVISSKKFRCILIPLISGKKNIPEITFSYFDPDFKSYVVTKSSPIVFNVNPGVYDRKQDNKNNNADIIQETFKPVKDNIKIKQYKRYLVKNKLFMLILFLFAMFAICSFIYRIIIIYIERDHEKMQKIKAYKKSVQYLNASYENLCKEEQVNFYTNLDFALKTFLQSKTSVGYMNMSKREIEINLNEIDMDPELIKEISGILKECETFKFKSVKADVLEMNKYYYKTKYIIKELRKYYE